MSTKSTESRADVNQTAISVDTSNIKVHSKPKRAKKQAKVENKQPCPKLQFYQSLGADLLSQYEAIVKPSNDSLQPHSLSSSTSTVQSQTNWSTANNSSITLLDSESNDSLLTGHRRSLDSQRSFKNTGTNKVYKHETLGTTHDLSHGGGHDQLELLISQYGDVSHMAVRDPSYTFWMNQNGTAAIHFKVRNKVAILGGDPLCPPRLFLSTLADFQVYCKQFGWKVAIIGAGAEMLKRAKYMKWATMEFGCEKVLNPLSNEVLLGKSGKRIVTQCKQVLDPQKGGVTLHVYSPAQHGRDFALETDLRNLYDTWRNNRNESRDTQAFITVFDLFALVGLMTFIYSRDRTGQVNGFAALRKLDSQAGYHIDPFIQSASAPRGTSDLLIFASLSYLHARSISHLSLGYEPHMQVGDITRIPRALHPLVRRTYAHIFGRVPVTGKEAFHARWKPDLEQDRPLYLVFVDRSVPSLTHLVAMTHFANISLRSIVWTDLKNLRSKVPATVEKDEKIVEARKES